MLHVRQIENSQLEVVIHNCIDRNRTDISLSDIEIKYIQITTDRNVRVWLRSGQIKSTH
jgi:hypothetical protein